MNSYTYEDSVEYDLLKSEEGLAFYQKYSISAFLSKGEISWVYKIRDKVLAQDYTLKAIRKSDSLSLNLGQVKRLMACGHPQIVKIIEVFETQAYIYIIKDYIEGKTLKEWVSEKGILLEYEVISIIKQVCDILICFHSQKPQKMIFRDIKPDNLVYHEGKVTLIDLASARIFKKDRRQDTSYVGTIGYASPEQFGFGQTDERTDIYNLGMTAYFLLYGQEPVNQMEVSKILQRGECECSKGLKDILLKMTYLDREARYRNCQELIKALEALSQDPKIRKGPSRLTFLVLTVMGLMVFGLLVYSHKADEERLNNPFVQDINQTQEINTGQVLMPDGQAFDKAYEGQLIIQLRTANGTEITASACKEDGQYALDLSEVEDGTYHLRMVKSYEDGLASLPEKVVRVQAHQIDAQELILKLQEPQLKGHLISKAGSIYNQGMSIFVKEGNQIFFLSNLDEEGSYYIGGLKVGTYELFLHALDGGLNQDVEVEILDEVTSLDIHLEDLNESH